MRKVENTCDSWRSVISCICVSNFFIFTTYFFLAFSNADTSALQRTMNKNTFVIQTLLADKQ